MEEYLRRVQSRLGADVSESGIHAVVGGLEPDVDTVAATLCLALHLSQMEPSGGVCVPVLCGRRGEAPLPEQTVSYLQGIKVSERSLLWKEDVDLVKLHHTGKLSLTLLRDGLLDSSEYHTLESSILRVVHHDGQQDTGDDGAPSTVATVAREILQEAAEHIRATLGEILGEALRLQQEALWLKDGRQSAQLEELMASLEQWRSHQLEDMMQRLTAELKEFSDGEMTIALTSLTTDKENLPEYVDGLKYFTQQLGYEGLVVLMAVSDSVHHPRQQVAVYSNNTDMLNQICSELEESSSWSLSGELEGRGNLQVYHIPINTSASSGNPPLLEKEIHDILKDFVDRRSSVLACHPSSRTSSTEGVAGSVEFSQGSSGITDMDGSDIERTDGGNSDVVAISRVIADGEEDPVGAGVSAGGELVSPDSGMTTIRSSRSSKESSVFLSDDSPVGEIMAGGGPTAGGLFLRNPSPLGLLSLSPPMPPERRKHHSSRNKSDNFDLFNFDPLHSSDQIMQARGERGDEGERGAGSSSLSEIDELSLLDFSTPYSLGGLEMAHSSIDHHGHTHGTEMLDTVVPPTPVNSLVGSRPPSSCGVRFFPEDVIERINGLQHKDSMSSSLSETWDELGFETPAGMLSGDGNTWNRLKDSESPQNIIEEDSDNDLIVDIIERESREEILKPETTHQRAKGLEPQLSLITDQTESYDNWNPGSLLKDQWDAVLLTDLQLTPPEDEITGKCKAAVIGSKDRTSSLSTKTAILKTLTPDTSKEEDKGVQGKKKQLDFWTYSAQKGFLKSDSAAATTSYPESLDMWNMTIRDDSLSPLATPDNLSENSGSFYGIHPNLKSGTSLESPLGYSDGGMQMWNTTIQEDSSSTITSPEGPENGKSLSHTGSSDASDTLESPSSKQVEENKATTEDSGEIHQTYKAVELRGNEINVRIVIDSVDDQVEDEGTDDVQSVQSQQLQKLSSKHSEAETSAHQGTDMWDLSVHGMVTSTSEYDNVGAGAWSLTSSPDTYSTPVVDMIQLEGQSSPFIAVTKPFQMDESRNQYRSTDPLRTTEFGAVVSDEEQSSIQVFLFEETSESSLMNKSRHGNKIGETDSTDRPGDHSPFLFVDHSSATNQISQSEEQVAETHILPEQSFSPSLVNWDSLVLSKHGGSDSDSSSQNMTITVAQNVDVPIFETQGNYANVESKIAEAISLSSSPGGERDTMNSPDSLQTGSQDKHGSSSDGDSFSGLEMESIVVSGTVKEAKGEWCDRPKRSSRQSKGTKKSMETFSMLAYAATILQTQAQTSHHNQQESDTHCNQIQSRKTDTTNAVTEQIQDVLSTHFQISADNASKHPAVPESISHSQSKNISEACHQSESKTQPEEEQSDNESGFVARSVSPSLRYPSDHFLKTREEVYVHSQISMEDSDEGGQSPSAPPQCPTSLGDFQTWGDHLVRQDTSQTTSEPQSPVLTNSSVSHTSSSLDTPVGDLCVSMEKGLGLPFSGDLMEEENDEEHEEEIDPSSLPKWSSEGQSQRNESQQLDLLSFTEDLTGGPSFQGTHLQTLEPEREGLQQSRLDYYHGQAPRADSRDKWSIEVQTGDHEASQVSYSPVSRRHQEVTSQLPPHPTTENPSYHWTPSLDTTQGQTQYGYNYHHIDQRTENQCSYSACSETKSDRLPSTTDVYAEFTSAATNIHYRSDPTENYYEAGDDAQYNLDDAGFKCQYVLESQYEADPSSMCASEAQYSPYQESGQSQYESAHAHYQADGQSFYHSEVHPETEDHARYVPDGYVHFLVSRNSQQGAMVKMASSEEAAEELDNREDPPSSTDISGGSNQRRKLAAPPMNVSLDRSEGSVLSDDALDTEDDGLDTGDDLDVNIEELDTPDETDSLDLNRQDSEESILGAAAAALSDSNTGHRAAEASRESKLWRSVVIGEQEHRIDMKCIEPYKRVISHGGYYAEKNAIIVFAACFLPDSDSDNYNYVMENLFLYVISTLELMVAEDYMIVYLNGATPRRRMPGFTWMKRCYQMIDRRLKKNLKMFIIVHPSWFIRTLLGITRPFISSKFSSKIKYVNSLRELGRIIPMEYVHIPPSILKYDEERATHKFACARLDTDLQDTTAK